jgi:hypothetical protein
MKTNTENLSIQRKELSTLSFENVITLFSAANSLRFTPEYIMRLFVWVWIVP